MRKEHASGHRKPLRRRERQAAPEPGVNDIIARYADTCHAADLAFLRGHVTINEMQQARSVARIIRDTSLAILRRKETVT